MKAMEVLSALNDVRDAYVLESALPPVREAPPAPPARRRRGKDGSLGRVFADGWMVAAVCTLVALGTLGGMIYLGQNPPTPPISTESPTVKPPESDGYPDTEGIVTESLTFMSHGDGTCSVKASDGFGSDPDDSHLTIPAVSPAGERVTAVADYGFIWQKELKTVTLPDTLETVGQWAFAECESLESVELPVGVKSIGTAAFLECTALEEMILPEGLIFLGDSAFSTCTALTRVELPSTLKTIPQWAFYSCASLEELTLPEGVETVGYSAFYGCTSLTALSLPASVRTLSKGAFAECGRLLSVTCAEGLTAVGSLAFDGCVSLVSVTLPATLETLAPDALRDCPSLRTVVFTGTRAEFRALIGETSPLPAGCNTHCADGVLKN